MKKRPDHFPKLFGKDFDRLLEIIMKSKPVFWYFLLPVECKEETLANNVQVVFLMGLQVMQKKKYSCTKIAIEACQLENFYLHYKNLKLFKQLYSYFLQLEEEKKTFISNLKEMNSVFLTTWNIFNPTI